MPSAWADGWLETDEIDEKQVCIPHTDQDVSIPEDEEQNVVLRDVVEVGIFLVGEEKVRFPQALEHVGVHRQSLTLEVSGKS